MPKRPAELDDVERRKGYAGTIWGLPVIEVETPDPRTVQFEIPQQLDDAGQCTHYVAAVYTMPDGSRLAVCLHCGHRQTG